MLINSPNYLSILNQNFIIMKKLFFSFLFLSVFIACNNEKAEDNNEASVSPGTETKVDAPAEFADAKYSEMGRSALSALSAGNVDGWVANYADNAVFAWNNGDSISGKAAIIDYWKKRMTEVIETLNFSNEIFLPLKVNKSQSVEAPGIWLLGWYETTAKYKKSGKSMTQWIHTTMHFDSNDKIDRAIMYLDRVPIMEASK